MPIIQTHSGQDINLLRPREHDINFRDIAFSLAKLCRFSGHTTSFYSVAQHSVLVADCLPPELQAYGLLHDAHEAFIGDTTSPVKRALDQVNPNGSAGLAYLAGIWDERIHEKAGLAWPLTKTQKQQIKCADMVLLATEKRDLLAPTPAWPGSYRPLKKVIKPLPEDRAAELFMAKFDLLIGGQAKANNHTQFNELFG